MFALAALMSLISQVAGTPYISGGDTPAGTDCSGLASWVANVAAGRPAFGSRFNTGNMESALLARGFQYGSSPNSVVIGWNGGHAAVTLPDGTPVSSGESGAGVRIGGGGAYQPQFTRHMFLPVEAAPMSPEPPAPVDVPPVDVPPADVPPVDVPPAGVPAPPAPPVDVAPPAPPVDPAAPPAPPVDPAAPPAPPVDPAAPPVDPAAPPVDPAAPPVDPAAPPVDPAAPPVEAAPDMAPVIELAAPLPEAPAAPLP